jgi:hypothetical protein
MQLNSELIVLLPLALAWWFVATKSLEAALIQVYLPVLMLIPDYFRLPIDGLPDPTFSQCAILPIGSVLFWKIFVKREWKSSPLDFTVIAFVVWQFISDFYNVGYKDAQNMFFDTATLAVMPYMAGKVLIEQTGFRAAVARRFVWLLFMVSVISIYEFRMGVNLFRTVISAFFPDQHTGWFTQIRWGFGRIAGPYGHAIAMGTLLAMAYLVCRWLSQTGQWERHFKRLGALPLTKSRIITGGLIAGMLMTLSRGPWLAATCGVVLASIGIGSDRKRALKRAILVLVGGGLLIYAAGKTYVNGAGPADSVEEQASAAYRAILVQEYEDIAMVNPIMGWGRANWPQVPGMESIDNNYLYIALGSGLVGVGLFILMIVMAIWRLFVAGYFAKDLDPAERAFRFTLLAVLASVAISTVTVYMASQLYPLFFMFLGWSEACIVFRSAPEEVHSEETAAPTGFRLMRVVA